MREAGRLLNNAVGEPFVIGPPSSVMSWLNNDNGYQKTEENGNLS
jgi:hypothetical protein